MKEIAPGPAPPAGVLAVPGSKYEANRLIAAAALTDGESAIRGGPDNEDIRAAIAAFRALGARIGGPPEALHVHGLAGNAPVHLAGAHPSGSSRSEPVPLPGRREITADVGESGTLLRFLTAAAATVPGPVRIRGRGRIGGRPIAGLAAALERLGARIVTTGGFAPLEVQSGSLAGGTVRVPAAESSQFASALLLAGPRCRRPLRLELEGEPVSASYLDLTVAVMARCGVLVERDGPRRFRLPPGACYRPGNHRVTGDWTSAGYWFAAAALAPGRVTVVGLDPDSPQGERHFAGVLAAMGCVVNEEDDGAGSCRVSVRGPEKLRGVEVAMNSMPDAAPTLAAIAPFASSPTRIRGIGHLRHKESDRIEALAEGLGRLGGRVLPDGDGLTVFPSALRPGTVHPRGDHRIAMALALTGLRVSGVRVRTPEVVKKSFPGFWETLADLGARVSDTTNGTASSNGAGSRRGRA